MAALCAFCRQDVAAAEARSCRRCWAPYHVDCWAANGRRCGIYGCEPTASAPEPAAVDPQPAAAQGGTAWRGPLILFFLLGLSQLPRLFGGPPERPAPPPPPRLDADMPRPPVQEFDLLLASARSLLREMGNARREGADMPRRMELVSRAQSITAGLERTGGRVQDERRRLQSQALRDRLRSEREALLRLGR